jgi:hypothetical protein
VASKAQIIRDGGRTQPSMSVEESEQPTRFVEKRRRDTGTSFRLGLNVTVVRDYDNWRYSGQNRHASYVMNWPMNGGGVLLKPLFIRLLEANRAPKKNNRRLMATQMH